MIANPEEKGSMIKAGCECAGCCLWNQPGVRIVAMPDPQGKYARPVGSLPPEQERQGHFVFLGTHEDVIAVAGAFQDRRQASGVAEGIRVEADPDINAQSTLAVSFAVERVANKAFSRRDIAVRLDGPTANDLPATFSDSLLNLAEHLRVGALHPTVVRRRRMAIAEAGSLIDAIQGAAECGEHRIGAVTPRP